MLGHEKPHVQAAEERSEREVPSLGLSSQLLWCAIVAAWCPQETVGLPHLTQSHANDEVGQQDAGEEPATCLRSQKAAFLVIDLQR